MDVITIDGMIEHDFRMSVEDMLRLDQVDEAVARLQALVDPYCGEGGILPPCWQAAARRRIEIGGWSRLEERLLAHDRKDSPITAIGVTLADATKLGGPGPSRGRMAPFVKTYYFSDEAYPFSGASRDDLLNGYTRDGFEWQGDYQATDATLSIRGLDDLYGPIFTLEQQLLASVDPDPEEIRAGTIGACYIAVLIHRGLRDAIHREGLPRPLCFIAACDGVYPMFDAPVAGVEASGGVPSEFPETDEDGELVVSTGEGSLLNLITRRHDKVMALTLSAEDVDAAHRYDAMAAEQRLEGATAKTLGGSVDLSLSGTRFADDGWLEPEDDPHRPPPQGWAPPIPTPRELSQFVAAPISLWDDFEDEAEEEPRPAEPRSAFDLTSEVPECPLQRSDGGESEALSRFGDEPAPENPPAIGSHSIRARIAVARVDADPAPSGVFPSLLGWFRRLLGRD